MPAERREQTSGLSVGAKLALATVVVVALVSALVYVQLTIRERTGLVRAKETAGSMVADFFAASIGAEVEFDSTEELGNDVAQLRDNPAIECVEVWKGSGVAPLVKSGGPCAGEDLAPGESRTTDDRYAVARVVRSGTGAAIGRALLVFSLARENEAFAETRTRLFWAAVLLAAATAAVLIVSARRLIVTPLRQLGDAAARVARGDFAGAAVTARSTDEIGTLARGFATMREAIADREQRLEAARQSLRDLFDHMRQAIVAFGPDGRVAGEVSRQAATLFASDGAIEGRRVRELLYGNDEHDVDAQAFDEWAEMAFEVDLDKWAELEALAPREVVLRRPDKRDVPLELEFRPIAKEGKIERVMLLATDVSEKRALEQTMHTQEEEHARRMAAMRRLVAGGGQVFVAFLEGARERFARCRGIVGDAPRMLPTAEIDELFRHVHTIKGEARSFDLRELEGECSKLEEELDELRALARGEGFATTGSVHGALTSRLRRAEEALERGREAFVEASPIGRAALDQITVQRSDLEELAAAARGKEATLVRAVDRLAARPFGESTASLVDMAPTWGDREGKRVRLDVEGREERVPPGLARVLNGVLTHLVRNAIAHGIETTQVREERGKPALGTIHAACAPGPRGPVITIEDDGRGLDLEGITAHAAALGVDVEHVKTDPDALRELVFMPGLTTVAAGGAADSLAGRGVGLGAVREDLARAGYGIRVESKQGKFTRFVIEPR